MLLKKLAFSGRLTRKLAFSGRFHQNFGRFVGLLAKKYLAAFAVFDKKIWPVRLAGIWRPCIGI
jgi:hypothetical protein